MNKEEFEKDTNKNGIYIFILSDCPACKMYMDELKKENVDTSKWNFVVCDTDFKYFLFEHNVDDIPCTRHYYNNKQTFEITGVLYDIQIKKLYNAIKK
jgi:hypothetical protein